MSWSRSKVVSAVTTVLLATTALAACGSDGDTEAESAGTSTSGFPVTLKNTFGDTTITKKPERIVTLGWNAQDVVYALGETPVGMPKVTYGPTAEGVTAWGRRQVRQVEDDVAGHRRQVPVRADRGAEAGRDPGAVRGVRRGDVQDSERDRADRRVPRGAVADDLAGPDAAGRRGARQEGRRGEADQRDPGQDQAGRGGAPEFKGKTVTVGSFGPENYVYMPGDPRVQILNEMAS